MTTGPFSFTADADQPPIVPCLARIDTPDVASVELHVRRHDRRGRTTIRTIRGLDLDVPASSRLRWPDRSPTPTPVPPETTCKDE